MLRVAVRSIPPASVATADGRSGNIGHANCPILACESILATLRLEGKARQLCDTANSSVPYPTV